MLSCSLTQASEDAIPPEDSGTDRPDIADKPLRVSRLAALRRLLFRRLPADEAKEVRDAVERDGALTERYILMCALSAGIATLGLLQSSTAVVIGAMLVSPLMSPIASLGFAFASLEGRRAEEAARVLGLGILVGVAVGMLLTWLSPIRNATPEIIARTAPTLLDLAVAVLSGIAGGYATVHRKGETAIGVAIATALMPPLATVGYSLAVARFDFAGGALLLFLTNLGAISFSFALVARIRGVARPLTRVDFKPIHVIAVTGAFLLLATPLALTLARVARETYATQTARRIVLSELKIDAPQLAQLNVRWDGSTPHVAATAIVSDFDGDATEVIRARLSDVLHAACQFDLKQIVAADSRAETQAMIEAALAQLPANLQARAPTPAGVPPSEPAPIAAAIAASRVQIVAAWPKSPQRAIGLMAAPADGFNLSDYRAEEARLNAIGFGWTVDLIPPPVERMPLFLEDGQTELGLDQLGAIESMKWALTRWASRETVVEGVSGTNTTLAAQQTALARAEGVARALAGGDTRKVSARAAINPSIDPNDRRSLTRVDILPFASHSLDGVNARP